jgi:AcrR family transcriptional regulator
MSDSAADKSRKKIILSAKRLFVKNGFNGTSLRDIANKANIPVSLIYHYFKNKAHLWKAVKYNYIQNSDTNFLESLEKCKTFKDFITQIVTQRIKLLAKNSDMVRLMDWQRLEDKQQQLAGVDTPPTKFTYNYYDYIDTFRLTGEVNDIYNNEDICSMILGLSFGPFIKASKSSFESEELLNEYAYKVSNILINTLVMD